MSDKNCIVVVVTYNGENYIKKCLSSCDSYRIVVVDNASTDRTIQIIKSEFPDVYILEQSKNLGFGGANNLGISYALSQGADYVYLLNQDAYLVEKALEELIAISNSNPNYGILSPVHTNATVNKLDYGFANYVSFRHNEQFYSDYVLENEIKPVYDVPFVNAAGWLLTRHCLENVGGFDPIFFHYGEDDNYCQRLLYHGFKIGVVPKAKMIHDRENRTKKLYEKGTEQYFQKIETSLKVKFANINDLDTSSFESELRGVRSKIFKQFVQGKFKELKYTQNLYKLYKNILPQIKKSKAMNKTKGTLYLTS